MDQYLKIITRWWSNNTDVTLYFWDNMFSKNIVQLGRSHMMRFHSFQYWELKTNNSLVKRLFRFAQLKILTWQWCHSYISDELNTSPTQHWRKSLNCWGFPEILLICESSMILTSTKSPWSTRLNRYFRWLDPCCLGWLTLRWTVKAWNKVN